MQGPWAAEISYRDELVTELGANECNAATVESLLERYDFHYAGDVETRGGEAKLF